MTDDDDVPTRRHCATSEVHRQLLSVDPDYRAGALRDREPHGRRAGARLRGRRAEDAHDPRASCTSSTATTRQNISNAQIQSQIRILNQDFRMKNRDRTKLPDVFKPLHSDTRVQFKLATKDVFGNATSGITRTRTSVPTLQLRRGRQVAAGPAAPTRGRRGAT